MSEVQLHLGNCLDILATMEPYSVDSIVTDPPAGIAFMGKSWDKDHGGRDAWIAHMAEIAAECLRVLKPGGHALVWALPRTSHWTATAWENGGFEVRDRVAHVFGSGFPKSHNVGKAIDKAAGAEREVVGRKTVSSNFDDHNGSMMSVSNSNGHNREHIVPVTAPATPDAQRWDGWGTALKPAVEDWWLLRKPFKGTVAANVLEWGTGAINVDGCRVDLNGDKPYAYPNGSGGSHGPVPVRKHYDNPVYGNPLGRWPANVITDGSDEVVGLFPNDAARFFYCAKASKRDRDEGLEGMEEKRSGMSNGAQVHGDGYDKGQDIGLNRVISRRNHHPTVKPTALMRYLCRLITPPGGVVLDPFCGSGSTGKAARLEGFRFVGIDQEAEYLEIARRRIEYAEAQVPKEETATYQQLNLIG